MIDKILGIRRLAWRVQPPKQWKKRRREVPGGFADVLRETMKSEATKPIRGNHSR